MLQKKNMITSIKNINNIKIKTPRKMEKQQFDMKEFKRTLSEKIDKYLAEKQAYYDELRAREEAEDLTAKKNNRRRFITY